MKNSFFVYVLRSQQKRYLYVGITNNIERRFLQHQTGKGHATAPYRPFDIIHTEEFNTRPEARLREKQLKSGSGKEWIKSKYPYRV